MRTPFRTAHTHKRSIQLHVHIPALAHSERRPQAAMTAEASAQSWVFFVNRVRGLFAACRRTRVAVTAMARDGGEKARPSRKLGRCTSRSRDGERDRERGREGRNKHKGTVEEEVEKTKAKKRNVKGRNVERVGSEGRWEGGGNL